MTDYRQVSLWFDQLGDITPRPPLTGDLAADVAIVGGGYTGLWTAYYLQQHDPSLRIAIVEAEVAGFGASGRNGGWCSALYPVSLPTLDVLLVFFFIWTWNEFFLPLVFLVSNQNQTVPVALGTLQGQHIMNPLTTSGAALLGVFPTVIFFLIFQRTLTRGVTVGSTK